LTLFALIDPNGIDQLRSYFNSPNLTSLFSDMQTSYFVHHDVADHNIRYLGQEIHALFDWENAVVYDPISDIGSAPTWKVHYPREAKLRAGFLAELGLKPNNFEAKVDVYFLRTMLLLAMAYSSHYLPLV
jgi:aminoglycoside phosphotransferase (APT) family kinase protein